MAKPRQCWSQGELAVVVDDYLEMLEFELAGDKFNKAKRREALQKQKGVDRTRGSIEYMRQNISAVMAAFGLPFIQGYKPATHHVFALFEVVAVALAERGLHERLANTQAARMPSATELIYELAPKMMQMTESVHQATRRLIAQHDPARRDAEARALGAAGEQFLLGAERARLIRHDRPQLAEKVCWVSRDCGDGAGFDILSFSRSGEERWLEVKTTNGPSTTPFFISENELRVSRERRDVFRLVRLYDFERQPKAYCLPAPLDAHVHLACTQHRATFRARSLGA